jgi:hypothetical protein
LTPEEIKSVYYPEVERLLRNKLGASRIFVFDHNVRNAAREGLAVPDDLVGARQKRLRHGQAKRPGGLEVYHQLVCGRPLDRQIGRLGALQDLSDVSADLVPTTAAARPIAD